VQLAEAHALAQPAARGAGAAGIGQEGLFLHQHRHPRLEHLDRGVGGRGRIQQPGFAVAARAGTLAAAHEQVVGIERAVGMVAGDGDGDRQAGRRLHRIGRGIGQGAEHGGGDIPAGAGARGHRRRAGAVQDGALRRPHGERPVAAGIAAHPWRQQAFQRIGGVRRGVVHRGVHAALCQLRRRAGEIQHDGIARNGQLQRQRQFSVHRAERHAAGIVAIRQGADRRAHRLFGTVGDDRGQRAQIGQPVFLHERQQALRADAVGGHEGLDVARHLRRVAHVLGDDGEQVFVVHAGAGQLHRRDLQALVEDLPRAQAVARAADIGDVPDGADQRDHGAVAEHRADHCQIEQVAGAQPRIVGYEHVARPQRIHREARQQRLHRARQRQVEHRHRARRMGQRLAGRVQKFAGEILRFRDDERKRRADDGQPHLVHHGGQPAPHDFERDRIGFDGGARLRLRHLRPHPMRRAGGGDADAQIAGGIDAERVAGRHDGGGFPLLHDGRAFERAARRQGVAIVDRGGDEAAIEPGLAFALARRPRPAARGGAAKGQGGRGAGGGDAHRHHLHHRVRLQGGVAGGVGGLERRHQGGQAGGIQRRFRQRHRDFVHLSDQAHVGRAGDLDGAGRAGGGEFGARIGFQRRQGAFHRGRIERGRQAHQQRAHQAGRERCGQEAECRGGAGGRRHHQFGDAQRARHLGRVCRAGAAEAHHGVAARVLAAFDHVDARRIRHAFHDDLVDAPGRLFDGQAQRTGDGGDGGAGRLCIQRHGAAQEEARIVIAEHQIGIGHGGKGAAAAVAGRAGGGTGGMRPDAQQADRVDGGDGAAAGADLDHVHRRRLDRQAGAFLEAVLAPGFHQRGDLRAAVLDQARLGGGAAHVEGQQIGVAGARAQQCRRQRAAGRA
jgi:hypothetical protein